MTLLVNLIFSEGIIMASDSLLTLNNKDSSFPQSYTLEKTFIMPESKIGISCRGTNSVPGGLLINTYINDFIMINDNKNIGIDETPNLLLKHLHEADELITKEEYNTYFYIGGYSFVDGRPIKKLYEVHLQKKKVIQVYNQSENNACNVFFGGTIDIVSRLVHPVKLVNREEEIKEYGIVYNRFSTQDAEDYCRFLIKTTSEMERFQNRRSNVGGEIRILLIQPHKTEMKVFS